MKRVSTLKGLCGKPLQRRYLAATEEERQALEPLIERESQWIIDKLARKGYQLEARVAGVYGLFTRGAGRGTISLVERGEKSVLS
ncbi:MAG: hypothetical protein ACYTHJ_17070 [Planctomycetota bacterium]